MRTTMLIIRALATLVLGSAFLYFWYWLALLVAPATEGLATRFPAWTSPLGWALLAAGAALAFTCAFSFVFRGDGTPAPFAAPQRLVVVGPYRYVRNPMYIGGIFMMVGFSLLSRSAADLGLAGAIWLVTHTFAVLYEEPVLRRKFDGSYEDYRASVRRWLPRASPYTAPGATAGDNGKVAGAGGR
jgi:protein-S-isoprenylcysteine O-methyltransferase Ste14